MTARRTLPQRRYSETFDLTHGDQRNTFQVTLGYFSADEPGEVFITGAKSGSDVDATTRDCAILLSLCLQHGVPLATMRHAITREQDGSASTIIGKVIERLMEDK